MRMLIINQRLVLVQAHAFSQDACKSMVVLNNLEQFIVYSVHLVRIDWPHNEMSYIYTQGIHPHLMHPQAPRTVLTPRP